MPLILVGGGARSGKSAFALRYARRLGERRVFIATAQAFDDEMRARIARHREERGAGRSPPSRSRWIWSAALGRAPAGAVVLVDCLTLWLSNLLLADRSRGRPAARDRRRWWRSPRRAPALTLLVSNEVGMGLVPETPLGRRFRDMTGIAHQRLAAVAAESYAAVMGVVLAAVPGTGADVPGGGDTVTRSAA